MRRLTHAGLLALAGLMSALPGVAAAQDGVGTVVVGLNSMVSVPDPHFMNAQRDNNFWPHVFEALTTVGENLTPTLQLAESYDVSQDGLTYTFHLRSGVLFHNGKTMTSADVLASWERFKRLSPNKGNLDAVASMSTPDDLTFVVQLDKSQPLFIDLNSTPQYPIVIIPAEDGDKEKGAISGIGTGPYRLVEQIADDRTVIERFPEYAVNTSAPEGFDGYSGRRQAIVDRIEFRSIPESGTRIAALQTGELDIADNLPVPASERLVASGGFVAQDVMPFSKAVVVTHVGNPPTDNVLVRRAIQAAINPEDVMEVALEGFYELSPSFVFGFSPYFPGEAVGKYYNQSNIDLAKSLLAEAGYAGDKVVILTNTNYSFMQNMALVVSERLKEAGMNVETQIVDWPTNVSALTEGSGGWNLTMSGYGAQPTIGPAGWIPVLTKHSHVPSDPLYDELTLKLLNEPSLEGRQELWKQIEVHVNDQAYMLPMGDRGLKVVSNDRLEGYDAFYSMRFWNVMPKQ